MKKLTGHIIKSMNNWVENNINEVVFMEIIKIDLESVNCYLGKQGDNFVLFDTGGHLVMDKKFTNRRELLEAELSKAGCTPDNLKLVVLTHGDNDHVANAKFIKEKYNAKIAMHSADVELVFKPTLEKMMESFNYKALIYKIVFKLMKGKIEKVTQKVLGDYEDFKPDIMLKDGDSLLEYGFDANILHVPGHTKGSIAILSDLGDIISGDTFTNNKTPEAAPNAIDFEKLQKSIARLCTINSRTVYPGHGAPFEMKIFKTKSS